jgi:hypothetical protein
MRIRVKGTTVGNANVVSRMTSPANAGTTVARATVKVQ